MTKVWRVKENESLRSDDLKSTDDVLEQLLINRGIKTEAEKERFFNSDLL